MEITCQYAEWLSTRFANLVNTRQTIYVMVISVND